MVLAAPVFFLSQTAAFRAFYAANREPLLRLALGSTIAYLSLRLLSKGYEAAQLSEDLERAARWRAHMEAALLRPDFLRATAGSVCSAGAAPAAEAALRQALSGALEGAAGAQAQADAAARQRSAWVVGLEKRMPVSGALAGGRARAEAAAAAARALAGSGGSSVGSGGGGGGGSGGGGSGSSSGAAASAGAVGIGSTSGSSSSNSGSSGAGGGGGAPGAAAAQAAPAARRLI
jgi:hypothetical protein